MKQQPKYGWETSFETAQNIMRHTFSDRVQVASNIKTGEVLVLVDGHTVNTYWRMPLEEYEALLLGCEEYAYELQRKDRVKAVLAKVAVYVIITIAILALFAIAGDNEKWSLGQFMAQKASCAAVMACCFYGVKHTPALATAWHDINENTKAQYGE